MMGPIAAGALAQIMKLVWDKIGEKPRSVSINDIVRMKLSLMEELSKIEDQIREQHRIDWEELRSK